MTNRKSGIAYRSLPAYLAGAMLLTLCLTVGAFAQLPIDAGTAINVRTSETIDAKDSDGRVFSGVVDQDVLNRNRVVVIPKGSNVDLIVRSTSDQEVALDLDAI